MAVICQTLLEKQFFQSEIKAKLEFPELFTPALDIDSHHLTSEEEAARSEAEIIEGITLNYEREKLRADTELASDDGRDRTHHI